MNILGTVSKLKLAELFAYCNLNDNIIWIRETITYVDMKHSSLQHNTV